MHRRFNDRDLTNDLINVITYIINIINSHSFGGHSFHDILAAEAGHCYSEGQRCRSARDNGSWIEGSAPMDL